MADKQEYYAKGLPMRIAALYDIHGNLPALEAVLDAVLNAKADLVVVGGDVITGPMPDDVMRCLLNFPLPVRFIRGNSEREVLEELAGTAPDVPESVQATTRWVAQQLAPEYRSLLLHWPQTIRLDFGDGAILFCHATPRSDTEIVTCQTPAARFSALFDEPINVSLVICGHTHMQYVRTAGRARVVNAGSVGMPYAAPGAYWLLLDSVLPACFVFQHTEYDLIGAAKRIRETDYPQADDFAENNVQHPPTEAEALAHFAKFEPAP